MKTTDLKTGDRVASHLFTDGERVESVHPFINFQGVKQEQFRYVTLSHWTPAPTEADPSSGVFGTRKVIAEVGFEWEKVAA